MKTTMEMRLQLNSSPRPAIKTQISGFTLIELIIVIVIVAIGVALAVPTFRSVIEKRQLTRSAESIAAFMNFAQSAAVKHDQDVIINMQRTDHDTWCIGATLGVTACDCTVTDVGEPAFCDINGVAHRIEQSDVISKPNYELMHSMSITGPTTSNFSFDPISGNLVEPVTVNIQMHTNTGSGTSREYGLEVDVLPTGRVSICTSTGRKKLLKMYPTCT